MAIVHDLRTDISVASEQVIEQEKEPFLAYPQPRDDRVRACTAAGLVL